MHFCNKCGSRFHQHPKYTGTSLTKKNLMPSTEIYMFLINIYIIFGSPNPAIRFFLITGFKCDIKVIQTDEKLFTVENNHHLRENADWSRWYLILRLSEKVVKERCRTMLPEKRLNCKIFRHVCQGENKRELFPVPQYKSKESILMLCKSHTLLSNFCLPRVPYTL